MQGKMNIEVLSEDKVVIHVTDNEGRRESKIVTGKAAAAALAGPNRETKDSGLIPQNILRIWETPEHNGYLVYQPARMFSIQYVGGNTYNVKLPGIVMKAVSNKAGHFLRSKSSIFICNGNEVNPDTKLWTLRLNNYSPSYGVCWGRNEDMVDSIMKSGNLFDIEQLPQIFFGSIFNNDLRDEYHVKSTVSSRFNKIEDRSSTDHDTLLYFMLKAVEDEAFVLENEISNPHYCLLGGVVL